MEWCLINICCILTVILTVSAIPLRQYRTDYEYNSRTNAFYKLHIELGHQKYAKMQCLLEGAELMVPSSNEDLIQAHAMLKRFPDIGDYLWIGADGYKHESAEKEPIIYLQQEDTIEFDFVTECDAMTRAGDVETMSCYVRNPFICKVEAKNVMYDDRCGVYGSRYEYYSSVESCYKVPLMALAWDQAYAECLAEGAHLVVLNSEAEHQAVWDLIRAAPRAEGVQAFFFFFAGIRANRPTDGTHRIFKTVFNETLEEAGYNEWSDGEPNNFQDSEYCGTIFLNNGKYNDVDCRHLYQFVCEKEVQK